MLKILVVDDDEINRMILETMLEGEGYDIVLAENGLEAIESYDSERPDMILMDVMMPEMDGYEATRIIKEKEGNGYIPIIFLTAITNETELAKCVSSGGDDFLTKPVNQIILMAKIEAFERSLKMYQTILKQNSLLEEHQYHLQREQEVAKKIFNRLVHSGCLDNDMFKYLLSPLSVFNGDLLLAAVAPSGCTHVLLGDATGHGLPAALGAIPVAEIFYDMTAGSYSVKDIIDAVNLKLNQTLPVEYFVCTCVLSISADNKRITIWNSGLPEGILYSGSEKKIKQLIHSKGVPLGIMSSKMLNIIPDVIDVDEGDRLFIYSDGIIEANNKDDEMFGDKRLEECFSLNSNPDKLFDEILSSINLFRGDNEQNDDFTMLEIRIPASK